MGPKSKKPRTRDHEDFITLEIKMIKIPTGVTEKAQLYTLDGGRYWLPLSVIKEEELDDQRVKNQVIVKMPKWLAEKNKIEDYAE